ncbi:glycosyltransferase family 4 protein [Haloarcula laminariae]|uniref:glycosyltransferase family 4 protein n=1 Tax=Haloarcula laminariae TaxID=2961577 RepID=UPI0021C58A37|nr:glycosyltransferase family 4 protein [Halomicroarcula laminariae]
MSADRILQVITRSDWGGAQRVVESLSRRLDGVTDVACGPGGRLIDRLTDSDVTVHLQPHLQSRPQPSDLLAYRDLRHLLEDGDFDIVHSHSTKAGVLARTAAARAGVPSVFTVHGWGFYNTEYSVLRPLVVRGERRLARHTDRIVCVSENDRRQGRAHGILSPKAGTVIHNGIQPHGGTPDRARLREEFGINSGMPIVGAVARLAEQKNPLKILRTACQLRDRGHEFATVLIGSGPLSSDCQSFVEDHGMENTFLPGFREDALELLPAFDVFLLPSRFEGLPLTVLESLHAGVPVVAYDVGGVAEAIDDGVTGMVVSSGGGRFADAVETLLGRPEWRRHMGRRAQQVAGARFTEDRMVARYGDLYRSLAD